MTESEKKHRYEELKTIRDHLVEDKNAPLYKYRTENRYYPVIGEGSHDASIMFVGEAPGETEAKTGRPFCGSAGKFLDTLLESIGLDRTTVYITNLVKDRPPGNRDPLPEEIAYYSPLLIKQLEIIKPSVVVTLGRYSMAFLMEHFGLSDALQSISKIHGKVFTPKEGTLSVVTLYHPAVALYNGSMRQVLLDDFQVLKKFINKGDSIIPPGDVDNSTDGPVFDMVKELTGEETLEEEKSDQLTLM